MSTLTAPLPHTLQPLRLRWDRVAALAVVLLLLAWLLAGAMAGRSDADPGPVAPVQVVVQPGDTIWDMARQHAPAGMATLEYVMLVEQHNDVRSGALIPGTVLLLPQSGR